MLNNDSNDFLPSEKLKLRKKELRWFFFYRIPIFEILGSKLKNRMNKNRYECKTQIQNTITKDWYIHRVNIPGFSVQKSLLCEVLQSWHGLESLDWPFIKHNSLIRQWSIKDNYCKYNLNRKKWAPFIILLIHLKNTKVCYD